VGGTIGLASLVTVFSHAATSYARPRHLPSVYLPGPFTHGADAAFLTGSLFMLVGFIVAVSLISIRPSTTDGEVPG